MILSKQTIEERITRGQLLDLSKSKFESNNVLPATLNLTIGKICIPTEKSSSFYKRSGVNCVDSVCLGPSETVLIEIQEYLNLSNDVAGLVFAPNRLARKGLLITNPGHIDPGYQGPITLCLVNMGRESAILRVNDVIARLMFFETDRVTEGYKGSPGAGVSFEQVNCLGQDFGNISQRMPEIINKFLATRLTIALGIVGVVLTLYALFIPELGKYRLESRKEHAITEELIKPFKEHVINESKTRNTELLNRIEALEQKLEKLSEKHSKDS